MTAVAVRDWSCTVWPALGAAALAAFSVAESLGYRADPVEHPERLTLSRASKRWLRAPVARAVFVAVCSVFPWAFLVHVDALSERPSTR